MGDYDILTPTGSLSDSVKKPSRHKQFCMLLAELERWAPTAGRLRDDEMKQMSQFFGQKMDNLEDYPPTGTEEQQFEALERLTKLRDGPLGIRGCSGATLDLLIDLRVRALSGKGLFQDHEVCQHTSQECSVLMSYDLGCSTVSPLRGFRLDLYHDPDSCC